MAPGNNGANTTPEGDDPFGYLYADGQAAGATPPEGGGGGYGYPNARTPRTSYNQVRAVGERQYGQQVPTQQQTAAYQQQPGTYGRTGGYNQPNAHYQAPETLPGGPAQPGPPQAPSRGRSGGRGSGGPNTKALLIGAVAVVAAVVIGIGIAMLGQGGDDQGDDAGGAPSDGPAQSVEPSKEPSQSASAAPAELPRTDAKKLTLAGGTSISAAVKGAKADGGQYVAGFTKQGAALTWTVSGIPKDGQYKLHVDYGVPGKDSDATIDVNGTKQQRPLNMENFAHAKEGDWEKGWTNTWALIQLTKGTNAITISCDAGNQCNANFDRFWLTKN
ncbi:carbohydrate-binding protein [Streptomyces sp. SID5785]|uniref:carbohydrate-binding protein n=1 Tax=Streptomyces sp. SID5785 TaxID=2690309 RepID=UPI001361E513|nr:carbohydrate-binding protein [Streptomyces sp. SID5785]MZD08484.1 carbohydrate-binding protein [Streptomyces sp. SID5785]